MAGLNKCMIIGNLGRDPETTYTQGGTAICKIAVATSEEWKDKTSGEKKEKTEWHRITFFGKQAETIGRFMAKGSQIYVEGKLQTSKYTQDGIDKYSTDIIANNFQFIGSKSDNQSSGQQNYQQPQNQGFQAPPQQSGGQQPMAGGYQQQQTGGYQSPPDDSIPF